MKTHTPLRNRILAGATVAALTAMAAPSWAAPSSQSAPGFQTVGFQLDQGGQNPPSQPSRRNRSQMPPGLGQAPGAQPDDAQDQSAFLRVIIPKKELTVGELVPVQIKAYFRSGVSASLDGLPMLGSEAFALNKLSEHPEQTHELIGGVPYSVVTWSTALAAVKAGDFPLKLDLPVSMRVQERSKRPSGGHNNPFKDFFSDDSPFDNSFFDDFFAQTVQKQATLHSDDAAIKIKPLPTRGRPADFSGAVGQFDVASEVSANSGTTGDPLTLKFTVTGSGNFDRVTTAGLAASNDWKTYKPTARFSATDDTNTMGAKTFEQAVIPMKAGARQIPALRFSYFDPDTESYVTKTAAPITINVAQGAAAAPSSSARAQSNAAEPDAAGLPPDKAEPAHPSDSLRPIVLSPWYLLANAAMLTAMAAGAAWRILQRRRGDNAGKRQQEAVEKSVHESLAAMDAALASQDAPRFFTAACKALQDRLAERWSLPASRVTIPEIRSRLNGSGEELRAVFQTADEIAYSGKNFSVPDLHRWRDVVGHELDRLARP